MSHPDRCRWTVYGACVGFNREAPPAVTIEPGGVQRAIEWGAKFWRVEPDVVSGWEIIYRAGETRNGSLGCESDCGRFIELGTWEETYGAVPCPSRWLPHELGHVVLGDADHSDARWAVLYATLNDPTFCPEAQPAVEWGTRP